MAIHDAPPQHPRAAFAEDRRARVEDALEDWMPTHEWVPLHAVLNHLAEETSFARALIVESVLELGERPDYSYRIQDGVAALRRED